MDALRARGYTIDQSDDVQRLLDAQGANAATFLVNDLLLRRDPRKVEVLEEYLHNVRRRLRLDEKWTRWELELHVKDFMVRHRTLPRLTAGDVEWLQDWLAAAEPLE